MPPSPSDIPYDDQHDLIKREKLFQLFEISPEFATVCGYRGFDDQLPRADRAAVEGEFAFLDDWYQSVQAIPEDQLSAGQQLDRTLFQHLYALHCFYYEEIRSWERSPSAITEVGQIAFLSLIYDNESEEKRFSDIASRLEALPQFVAEHKTRIKNPPYRWRDISLQTTIGMLSFFDAVAAAAMTKVPGPLAQRMTKAATKAKEEAHTYAHWLKELTVDASESWALGPERFDELIRLRNLGLDSAQILARGEELLDRYQTEQKRLAKGLVGSEDVDAAKHQVEVNAPPNFEAALETTRRACAEAREFLREHHLVDLPMHEELRVMETPEFLRPLIPFAAIFPPSRFGAKQIGNYIVTPPTDPKLFAKHLNYTSIYNTAVHEGYPGHHLQLSTANLSCSFLRSTPFVGGKATELVEGWAHYCEELMKDRGFHDTPEGRFVMISDLVWRATRIIIDVKLSRGEMSCDEAVAMLMTRAQMTKEGATAEVNRYIYSPSYQLSYLIGKELLLDLKRAVKTKEQALFSEASFHNRLLRAGSIPIAIIRTEIFGL